MPNDSEDLRAGPVLLWHHFFRLEVVGAHGDGTHDSQDKGAQCLERLERTKLEQTLRSKLGS